MAVSRWGGLKWFTVKVYLGGSVERGCELQGSEDVKRKMMKYRDRVNWAEELRRFLISRVEELERRENLERVVEGLGKTGSVPRGFSAGSVGEDRDSG